MKKIVLAALSILLLTTSFASGNKKTKQKDKAKQDKCCDKGSCCDKTKDGKTCCL